MLCGKQGESGRGLTPAIVYHFIMKKIIFFTFIIFSLIVVPAFCFAVDLEQIYPTLNTVQTLNETTSISGFISYISTWAIVLAVLIVIITLIISGVQYLTSAGRPQAMTEARTRIYKAFLGLAILVASYLILVTVNPQLMILELEYVPFKSGLFLLTQTGYEEFDKDVSKMNELIEQNEIYVITHDIRDMSADFELGALMIERRDSAGNLEIASPDAEAAKVNFYNFQLYAIGFWGEREEESKIALYSRENFEGIKNEYSFFHKLEQDGTPGERHLNINKLHGMEIRILNEDVFSGDINDPTSDYDADFFKTDSNNGVNYINIEPKDYDTLEDDIKDGVDDEWEKVRNTGESGQVYGKGKNDDTNNAFTDLIYPPLSLRVTKTGPGVYLYSSDADGGEERRFNESVDDLDRKDIKFDKKAEKIKIANEKSVYDSSGNPIPVPSAEKFNYLVTLHEEPDQKGSMRIFFEKKVDESEQIPIYCSQATHPGSINAMNPNILNTETESYGKPFVISPDSGLNACGYDEYLNKYLSAGITLEEYTNSFDYYPSLPGDTFIIGNMGIIGDDPDTVIIEEAKKPKNSPAINVSVEINNPPDGAIAREKMKYGTVEYVSSLGVYELSEEDPSVCREVKICTEKTDMRGNVTKGGYCIIYEYKDSPTMSVPVIGAIKYPMPLYLPVNIPKRVKVVKSTDDEGQISEFETKSGGIEFAQNIKSITMNGSCLVALFENKVEDWVLGDPLRGPGPHSELFERSESDLSGFEIGRCGSYLRQIAGRYLSKPCAQSIAVYPIKEK